jgi:signal transduction histidine kinase
VIFLIISNLWFCYPADSLSTENQLDSLKKVSKVYIQRKADTQRDTLLIKSLLEIAYHYNDIRLDSSKFYIDSAQRFCETIKWQKGFGFIGRVRGHYFFRIGLYDKSIKELTYALKIAEQYQDETLEASINIHIGTLYVYNNLYEKAKKYFIRGSELYKASGNETMFGVALANIGNSELKQGKYLSAISYFRNSLAITQKSTAILRNSRIVSSYNLLAVAYLNAGMYDSSKVCEQRCVALGTSIKNHQNIYDMYAGFSKYYLQKNDAEKSISYAEKALFYANQLASIEKKSGLYKLLYENYKKLDHTPNALYFLEKHKALEDSIVRVNVSKQIANLDLQSESDQQKSQIQQLTIEKLTQNKNYLSFILFISLFSIALFSFLNYRLKKSNRSLLGKNKEISEAMLKGQTTERKRVASDLHDNLGSTMSSIRWAFQSIDTTKWSDNEKEIFTNVQVMFDKAYDDIRLLSHNLLPEEFERFGLKITLQNFIRKININTSINFNLTISEDFKRMDNRVEFELYSICLELVNNIMKHSQATQAKIELYQMKNQVKLIISDNGIGIFNNDSDGKGMKNVQARVNSLNGTWKIQNTENQGFVNKILIPV